MNKGNQRWMMLSRSLQGSEANKPSLKFTVTSIICKDCKKVNIAIRQSINWCLPGAWGWRKRGHVC